MEKVHKLVQVMHDDGMCTKWLNDDNELRLFFDTTGILFSEPKFKTFLTIPKAVNRWNGNVIQKFEVHQIIKFTKQLFSWHRNCFESIVYEENLKQKETERQKKAFTANWEADMSGTQIIHMKQRKSQEVKKTLKRFIII